MRKKSKKRFPGLSITLIILVILLVGVTVTTKMLCNTVLSYDKIYKGIYVDEIYIGELTKEEATALLTKELQDKVDAHVISLKSSLYSGDISFSELDVKVNIEQLIENSYTIGREGSNLNRIKTIIDSYKNSNDFVSAITYSTDKLNTYVDNIKETIYIQLLEPTYEILASKVTISSGHDGKDVNTTLLSSLINEKIFSLSDSTIDIPIITRERDTLNLDEIFSSIHVDPVDAKYEVVDNEAIVVSQTFGQSVNHDKLETIISSIEANPNESWELPYFTLKPEIYDYFLKSQIYTGVLSTYETWFYIGDPVSQNRGVNITLAGNALSGKVLGPGDEFSFNDVVGRRTAEGGYLVAHVYDNGEIVDGLAGGICQVSSTLYNAVLRANLDTTERSNHQFSVGYTPLGFDATVSYGSADFKFINDTDYPVKVMFEVYEENNIRIQIIGTKEEPSFTYETKTEIIETFEYKSIETPDDSLYIGQKRIDKHGHTGYLVDAYLVTKKGFQIISEDLLHRDYYNTYDEKVSIGTKPLPENETLETLGLPEIVEEEI